MKQIPLLFYSDNPALNTGLSRICKDLAVLSSALPEFRIGSFGRGDRASSKLPFAQYTFGESEQWGERLIEDVWDDFAGSTPGIIFTIWDPSRFGWFANPMMGGRLESFLRSGRFQRWGYFPVDAYGVDEKLTGQCSNTVAMYDRVLAYTIFGSKVLGNSLGHEVDWIPHGYNDKVFQPRERAPGRMTLNVPEGDVLVGMVATNQARKDWGVAFESIAILKKRIPSLKFWIHIDELERYWSIPALIYDFGLQDTARVTFSSQMTSEQLSYLYSACDVTMLASSEGFGYPLIESMACGVPAVHGMYGGGEELIPDRSWLVPISAMRLDTLHNVYRPVFSSMLLADTVERVLNQSQDGSLKDVCTNAVSHLIWQNLWPAAWKKFFMEPFNDAK